MNNIKFFNNSFQKGFITFIQANCKFNVYLSDISIITNNILFSYSQEYLLESLHLINIESLTKLVLKKLSIHDCKIQSLYHPINVFSLNAPKIHL